MRLSVTVIEACALAFRNSMSAAEAIAVSACSHLLVGRRYLWAYAIRAPFSGQPTASVVVERPGLEAFS